MSPEVLQREPPAQQLLLATGVALAENEVEPDGKHDINELPPSPHIAPEAAACRSSRVLSSPPIFGLGLHAGHAHSGGC